MSDDVDRALDELAAADHSHWLALHQDEADAAHEWLAAVLGEQAGGDPEASSSPADEQPTNPEAGVEGRPRRDGTDWRIEVGRGGTVGARHEASGAIVTASLALVATTDGIRLRLLRYQYAVPDGFVTSGPPAPVASIERAVNEEAVARSILVSLREPPSVVSEVPTLRIPLDLSRRRPRPDEFYRVIAGFVRTCTQHRIAYGSRLAADNGVPEGTVRSWVHEARRRGLLERT